MTRFSLIVAGLTACGVVLAETQPEGERPPRPQSASNAAVGGWCDALTGAKKQECLREERERQLREPRTSRGGPLDAQSRPGAGAGATRPAH